MVTRKPVASEATAATASAPAPIGQSTSSAPSQSQQPLPYPTTPIAISGADYPSTHSNNGKDTVPDIASSHDFDLIDIEEVRGRPRRDSDISSHGTWDSDDSRVTLGDLDEVEVEGEDEEDEEIHKDIKSSTLDADVPQPLHIKSSRQSLGAAPVSQPRTEGPTLELPASLRPGGAATKPVVAPSLHAESQKAMDDPLANPWQQDSRNPYHNRSQDTSDTAVNQHAYGASAQHDPLSPIPPSLLPAAGKAHIMPTPPSQAPPQVPTQAPPQAPPQAPSQAPPPPPAAVPSSLPPAAPYAHSHSQSINIAPVELPTPSNDFANLSINSGPRPIPVIPLETAESLGVPEHFPGLLPPVSSQQTSTAPAFPSTNPWRSNAGPPSPSPPAAVPQIPASTGAFSPIEPQISNTTNPNAPFQHSSPPSPIVSIAETQYLPPPGPPPGARQGQSVDHQTSASAFAPHAGLSGGRTEQDVQPASTAVQPEIRNEHYQIKHVSWMQNSRLRQSPVLTQNANGPCPLLALVNALVLSTPQDVDTALVEALRTREQISLGLLLDIVFDELMSGRRGDTANRLPDVSELYAFLRALHTGMNVNPSFIVPAGLPEGTAGCFEETKEMRLYGTFHIPLIHGWLPPKNSTAHAAFERSAMTFEDAQNIQFLQSELEDKLQSEGLPQNEQQLLQDIHTIKGFFEIWPTQLTDHGLQAVVHSLQPGQVAILFRNDHFSTLYKEPTRGALMTLVTDAGYSSHEEIVWESLVDVNGAAGEMFSGDFRTVSHSGDARVDHSNSHGNSAGGVQHAQSDPQDLMTFETPPQSATHARHSGNGTSSASAFATDTSNMDDQDDARRRAAEQEDHDLALALQLQEEEEDRHRRDEERRRQEQELTEQLLSGEGENEVAPAMPPRRNGNNDTTSANQSSLPAPLPPRPNRVQSVTRPGRSNWGNERPAVSRPADDDNDNGAEVLPSYEQAASDRPYRPNSSSALGAYDALTQQQQQQQQQHGGNGRRYSSHHGQGGYANGNHRPMNGAPGAPSVRDADERCVVM